MVQHISTVAFEGVEARPIDVQVQVAPGLPAFNIVGLPDKAVSEARERVPEMLRWMESQDFAGRVLQGAALAEAGLPPGGTLVAAVSLAADDEPNAHGIRGRSDVAENALGGESLPGHGQHGGLGQYEQRPFLAMRGPGIAPGRHGGPASLVDLAPTFLRHLGLPASGMDGAALCPGMAGA